MSRNRFGPLLAVTLVVAGLAVSAQQGRGTNPPAAAGVVGAPEGDRSSYQPPAISYQLSVRR
jgi:hypothetical protein